jgi:hypothetical protein
MLRFPNRTGEIATYGDGIVTLSGQALPGMRTFAASAAVDRIANADTVGLSIRAVSDAAKWAVWQAAYTASTGVLTANMVEDESASAIAADALVEVTACVTDGILRHMTYTPPDYDYGPPNWVNQNDPAELEWLALDGLWRIIADATNGFLEPDATNAALTPTTFSVDVFVPAGADLTDASTGAGFVLTYGGGYLEQYAGGSVAEGWNTVSGTVTGQTGDITGLGLFAPYDDRAGYRYRNFTAT